MADNTPTEEVIKAAESNPNTVPKELNVTRGADETNPGITWKFEQAKLKKKNAKDADRFALVPVKPVSPEDFTQWLAFLDVKNAALLSYQRARGMSANWTTSSINKAGEFSETDFTKCVVEMSARGETIRALNEERLELMNEIITLSSKPGLTPVQKVERMTEIANRLNEINETIAFRQSEGKSDEELASPADETQPGAQAAAA